MTLSRIAIVELILGVISAGACLVGALLLDLRLMGFGVAFACAMTFLRFRQHRQVLRSISSGDPIDVRGVK